MIAIVNVSSDETTNAGVNQYQVRINRKVIAEFEHDRQPNGLARCLRDAADAVDRRSGELDQIMYNLIIENNT